jgi:putative transposase
MLGNGHVRFGGRVGETHQPRGWRGAPTRPLHLCGQLVGHGLCRVRHRRVLAADRGPAAGQATASGAFLSPQQPNPMVVPSTPSLLGVLRRPLEPGHYTSIRYTERLAEIGAAPSVGSVGDSYDNSLAESTIGLYKTELIRRHGPWRMLEEVELATLAYVDWFNHRRLHGQIGNLPPAELEATYYRQLGQAAVA